MKTALKIILALTLLMFTGVTLAQHTDSGHGRSHDKERHQGMRGKQAMPMVGRLVRALHHLDLSDEQQESIHAAMQKLKSDVHPVMQEMKAGHNQLKELVKATEYDATAVTELAAKEGELAAQRLIMTSRTLAEVLGYLTDEQRAELEEMSSARKHRRHEKRKQRARED